MLCLFCQESWGSHGQGRGSAGEVTQAVPALSVTLRRLQLQWAACQLPWEVALPENEQQTVKDAEHSKAALRSSVEWTGLAFPMKKSETDFAFHIPEPSGYYIK